MESPPEADPMAEQTKKFKRLGEYVYELQHEEDPEAVIVFFHGLLIQETDTGHAFWSTWTKRNKPLECWPVTMLPEFLESRTKREKGEESPPRPFRIRVLAVSYEGRTSVHPDIGTAGTDKYLLAESLISELILSPQDLIRGSKAVEDNDVPVFLVGHDLGGLIIKNFVMEVERTIPKKNEDADGEKLQNFLSNLKAVFFYATPHSGSQAIEYLAKQIPEDSRNQMLTLMSVLGTDMARINSVFSTYRSGIGDNLNHQRFKTYGIVPTSLTNQVAKTATDEQVLPQIQVGLVEKSRKDEKRPKSIDMSETEEVWSAHRAGSFRESAWEEENDSVHVLKSAELSRKSTLDCVFFHGLQLRPMPEPHKFTWISQSEPSEVWLKWLHEIHPTMRIIAVSYDASMKEDSKNGSMDLYQVAENLLSKLILAGVGQSGPIIFVGHNLGGIIAKAISRQAHFRHSLYENDTDITNFLENLRGLFYFGVPHRGSSFTDIEEQLSIVKGQLVDYVKVSSKELSRLNEDHDALCKRYDWKVAGVGESLPTNLGNGFCGVIVDKASARCRNFMIVDQDHPSLCQPESRNSSSYLHLKEFIDRIQAQVTKTATDEQVLPQIQVGLLEKSRKDEEFQQQLVKDKALGFWGMVGVGKTTLCKAIFNDLWNAFPYTLFAEGVKQIPGDEREFEETVLCLVHHKGKKITPAPNLVQLRGKKLLVAFDDVEKDREIDLLRKLSRTLLDSSRYIVTSQNRQMLNKIDGIHIFEVAPLDGEESKLLFKTLAFPDNQPLLGWQEEWMEAIVQTCGGLPLTLEIVANYLKGCISLDVWQQMPEYVGNADHGETVGLGKLWMQLKTSYDNLGPEEKQMFLEAATLFQERFVENHGWRHGQRQWTLSEAKVIWSMMHGNEALHWRTLVDRSMVSDVADDSVIRIHELFKCLGHSLADTDDFKIRVDSVENLLMILQDGKRKIKVTRYFLEYQLPVMFHILFQLETECEERMCTRCRWYVKISLVSFLPQNFALSASNYNVDGLHTVNISLSVFLYTNFAI
ncbi:hypothetical protein Mp_4g08290 [Marchantia polymorpha subsp. ruderalis]|uniref:NB-ARC domain-containing protein n=4 Tax=Marchantia polymorpha TaxID=3197 RepID=A0AAF6B7P8_MARPO|nr:hypothetical protein MARPO_0120s0017 [Marchantia polymorpha]BBN08032.1 hypothetical protein Mp_4g08290 [Marchantia polymorpha subsp. ruderalis]|eukprot:PTQ30739.1 hypothetical protein MARPO_0120s0017 [Marchantia polymorpha]